MIKHLIKNRKIDFTKDVTFFVGENGTGNFNFSTSQTHSDLYEYLTISKTKYAKDGFFLRAESFYNVAINIDETGGALSPSKLFTLIAEIGNLVKEKSQFIIATHSQILMAFPNSTVYQFSDEGTDEVNYKETEHYQLTNVF